MDRNKVHDDNSLLNHDVQPPDRNETPTASASAPDPFDPERLRLSQDYAEGLEVEKVLTRVAVRKPHDQEFIRVRRGEKWRLTTWILFDKNQRGDAYLVSPEMVPALSGHVRAVLLVLAVTRQGNPFLWPLKLPGPDGRGDIWNETARDCAQLAETDWICVKSNLTAGYYQAEKTRAELGEPEWPENSTMRDFLRLGFGDKYIDKPDHPIAKKLRGEE